MHMMRSNGAAAGDYPSGNRAASCFGARFRHAVINASRTGPARAVRNRTVVFPALPQAPVTGAKVPGWARRNHSCWSGVRATIPHPRWGYPSVAKIRPRDPEVRVTHVGGLGCLWETQG